MDQPTFEIADVTAEYDQILAAKAPKRAPGEVSRPKRLLHASSTRVYQLRWKGDRSPRGAVVTGKTIGWASSGCVTDLSGQMFGTYDRLVDCGGEFRQEQEMLVYVDAVPRV